ncbi:hypothetical protein F2P44_08855 [Massilia sp. CCM 8695]|uniref:Thiopeptide-type bacteriocin biosynthesis domain-containing protein n=1 Tax=Massilia frigida TaxID=2609281 RepID=A0ABX0N9C5_9BURK|nr:thiopeptide-type bacteriocin biosynthesis protein [Massilia frigida]NHZ79384.1 hypothetical protein [Massilia frigida]
MTLMQADALQAPSTSGHGDPGNAIVRPPQRRNADDWVYAQLFLSPELSSRDLVPAADEILFDILAPLFAAWKAQGHTWFFIRYQEHGYHLRLRVHAESAMHRARIKVRLSSALAAPLARGAQLRFAKYEPEIDKYCGPHGNSLAEQHFCASSVVSLRILADDSTPLTERALRLLASTLETTGLDAAQSISWCRAYYDYWWRAFGLPPAYEQKDEAMFQHSRGAIASKFSAAQQAGTDGSPRNIAWLHDWTRALKQDIHALKDLEGGRVLVDPIRQRDSAHTCYPYPVTDLSMLPNFWHMLCNRLGVSVRQEMQLVYCLMRHLTVQHGIEPTPMTMSLISDKT